MKKILPPFRFKQFSVSHSLSSMRIGVDGVLIGAWAGEENLRTQHILDVGCGCGLIALMMAQRYPGAQVDAVDIDMGSVEECRDNFNNSQWHNRLTVLCRDVNMMTELWRERYDLIVSNPPFYDAGVISPHTPRGVARHDGSLSPLRLIELASIMLIPGGRVAFIAPADRYEMLARKVCKEGLLISRVLYVRGNKDVPNKRVLLEAVKPGADDMDISPSVSELIIELERGQYTEEYISLTGDFYLNM